jgi:hypothetical protein
MYAKSIQLFDSQGKKEDNIRFLKAVENNMSDTLSKTVEGERQDLALGDKNGQQRIHLKHYQDKRMATTAEYSL